MITPIVVLLLLVALVVVGVRASRRERERSLERRRTELEPVQKLAFEDITALGVELQNFDSELAGQDLDGGANADYQRALDAYESAKTAGDRISDPDDIRHVTEILDDGRYAIACVRARVAGEALPTRRAPCFFNPQHGMSVTDVPYAPDGGIQRDVPACELDAERVAAGAEPDVRQVMVGAQRVPYWQGGPAFAPYAAGYYNSMVPMNLLFAGMMFGSLGGLGHSAGYEGGADGGSDGAGFEDSSGGDFGGGFGDGGGFDGFGF